MPVTIKIKPKVKIHAHVEDILGPVIRVPPDVPLDKLDDNGMPFFLVRKNWIEKAA